MNLIDRYYRAFKALRKNTEKEKASKKNRDLIAHATQESEFFSLTKVDCKIEEDWIKNIEEGLEFVEKAIREERQFIRTHGEVVPIEKVKKVSKTSIEHLSRHSDFITRLPKSKHENLIPDKLYIVEKLTDYLVYENRFIYMLLSYLKDFIQIRLDKIKDKTTTYQSEMLLDKHIDLNQRHVKYNLKFNERRENDPFLVEKYKQIPLVDRVENIYAIAVALLATPLMVEVAKAPMIQPPVVKTNVLRMNPNFRLALNLYDYIMSYNKDGYEIFEVKDSFQPLPRTMADHIAETIQLSSTLTYIETENRKEFFENNYQRELTKEKETEDKAFKEELRILRKRIQEMNEDPSEYILKLEKRNHHLEQESLELKLEKQKNIDLMIELENLQILNNELKNDIDTLNLELSNKVEEIQKLNQKYYDDMTLAEKIHQEEMIVLKQYYEEKIDKLITEYEAKITELIESYEAKITELIESYEAKINDLVESYEAKIADLIESYESKINELIESYETKLQETIDMYETKLEETMQTYEAEISYLKESHQTEITEMKQEHESIVNDLEESHQLELEHQKDTYKARINEINEQYKQEKQQIILAHDEKLEETIQHFELEITQIQESNANEMHEIVEKNASLVSSFESNIESLKDINTTLNTKIDDLSKEYFDQVDTSTTLNRTLELKIEQLEEEKKFANANYLAIKAQQGLTSIEDESFTREKFKQLEEEMIAYKKHFKLQWKKAKLKIRENAKNKVFESNENQEEKDNDINH